MFYVLLYKSDKLSEAGINFVDEHNKDILLHVALRAKTDRAVLNSYINSRWAKESNAPIDNINGTFRLDVNSKTASLTNNGKLLAEFDFPCAIPESGLDHIKPYGPIRVIPCTEDESYVVFYRSDVLLEAGVNFIDEHNGDILLHIGLRAKDNKIVLNTRINDHWGNENNVHVNTMNGIFRLYLNGKTAHLITHENAMVDIEIPYAVPKKGLENIQTYGPVHAFPCTDQDYQLNEVLFATGFENAQWLVTFNSDLYEQLNPGLQGRFATCAQALEHFLTEGIIEGYSYSASETFNADFYTGFYDDVNALDEMSAYRHWVKTGKQQGRYCSEALFLNAMGFGFSPFPLSFDVETYQSTLPDNDSNSRTKWHLFEHWVESAGKSETDLIPFYECPEAVQVLNLLAGNKTSQGDEASAKNLYANAQAYRQAIQLRSTNVPVLTNMAKSYAALGLYHRAIDIIGTACELFPKNTSAHNRGMANAAFFKSRQNAIDAILLDDKDEAYRASKENIVQYLNDMPKMGSISRIRNNASTKARVLILGTADLAQCLHYRVKQKIEHLHAAGFDAEFVPQNEPERFIALAPYFDVAIFYRVPAFPNIVEAISYAQQLGMSTFYEIDDLIFDRDYFPDDINSYGGLLEPDEYANLVVDVPLFEQAMALCDYGIASTPSLQKIIAAKVKTGQCFLHRNAFGELHERLAQESPSLTSAAKDTVDIFYGSGTRAHNEDFECYAAPAIADIMQKNAKVRLSIVGYLSLPAMLSSFEDRIVCMPPLWDLENYWTNIVAKADINIAVLKPGLVSDCKSEIKWLEAAMLGVPSIVSATATYRDILEDGQTAMLATSVEEWKEKLALLVDDADLRKKIARQAWELSRQNYSIKAQAENISSIVLSATTEQRRQTAAPHPLIPVIEAFHIYLGSWIINPEENGLEKLLAVVNTCDDLQLLPEEISWLCQVNDTDRQDKVNTLILAMIPRLSSQSLRELLNNLSDAYKLMAQALVPALDCAETTRDWSLSLILLDILDSTNRLDPLPDWLAVESLWMAVQFEQPALVSNNVQKDLYRENLAWLKSFRFWQHALTFDRHFSLLDPDYLQHRLTADHSPVIAGLSQFLAQADSFTIAPHRLFAIDGYKHIAQLEGNSVHPLVHCFRHSSGYAEKSLNPNPYFDCDWYRQNYLPNNAIDHPLLHYLAHFQETGVQPHKLFCNDYIRETQGLLAEQDPLAYYLEQIDSQGIRFCLEGFSPNPFFDRAFYLQHNSKLQAKVSISKCKFDPFIYYIKRGQAKGHPAYPWQRYNEFVRHQRLYLEPYNQHSPFGSEQGVHYIKGEKAEVIYLAGQRVLARQLAYRPLVSILVPVFQVKPEFLQAMIESVLAQTYDNWQLCLVDDASERYQQEIHDLFKYYADQDQRIVYNLREQNGHICNTTNDCLTLAQGDYIALLDHDDLLTPDALYEMAAALNHDNGLDIIYSDEDKVDEWGMFFAPYYKPDWSPHSLWSRMYTCHLTVYRKSLVNGVGGFRVGFEGSQDYDLMLRCSEKTTHIHHIARVLYHWRSHSESTAGAEDAKGYSVDAGYKALQEALLRRGLKATVHPVGVSRTAFWVKPEIVGSPLIDIIIPSRNGAEILATCLSSIFEKTSYAHFKVTVIDNNSDEKSFSDLMDYWSQQEPERFQVIRDESPFNFSVINNGAVQKTAGDYLLFLNNDTEVINGDWLDGMLGYAQLEEIGAVGVKLLYPGDTVQHAGVATGLGGVAGHVMKHAQRDSPGYFWNLKLVTDYSVVTAACLMVSRKKFNAVFGFNEHLQVAFNDVDFCLKLRQQGLYNVYLPFVELYHYESKSRGYEDTDEKRERFEKEILFMRQCWGKVLDNDPFYSPWLTLADETMGYRFH